MKILLPLVLALTTAGCAQHLARRDNITYSAGNSVEANKAIQVIDPWPRGSFRRGLPLDGDKALLAAKRYHSPDTGPLSGGASGQGASQGGTPGATQ